LKRKGTKVIISEIGKKKSGRGEGQVQGRVEGTNKPKKRTCREGESWGGGRDK